MKQQNLISKSSPFEIHQLGCAKCQQVDITNPRTLALVCLDGAPVLRDYLSTIAKKAQSKTNRALKKQFEDTTRTSKKKLQSVMKYVEPELSF